MRIAVTFLGLDLFSVEVSTDGEQGDDAGECTSYPVGFTRSAGDQAWEQGAER